MESLFERTTHLDAEVVRRRRAEVDLLQFHPHNSPWLRVKLVESLGNACRQVPGTAREKIGGEEDKRTKDVQELNDAKHRKFASGCVNLIHFLPFHVPTNYSITSTIIACFYYKIAQFSEADRQAARKLNSQTATLSEFSLKPWLNRHDEERVQHAQFATQDPAAHSYLTLHPTASIPHRSKVITATPKELLPPKRPYSLRNERP